VAKTATIMISLKSFNLSRLLSQQVASVCLGRELQGSNVFLDFFGCVWNANGAPSLPAVPSTQVVIAPCQNLFFNNYWRIVIHEIE
jgi:hypothetical protein